MPEDRKSQVPATLVRIATILDALVNAGAHTTITIAIERVREDATTCRTLAANWGRIQDALDYQNNRPPRRPGSRVTNDNSLVTISAVEE